MYTWYFVKHSLSLSLASLVSQLTKTWLAIHNLYPQGSVCKTSCEYLMQTVCLIWLVPTSWITTWKQRIIHKGRVMIRTWADVWVRIWKTGVTLLTTDTITTMPSRAKWWIFIILIRTVCTAITYLHKIQGVNHLDSFAFSAVPVSLYKVPERKIILSLLL